MEYKSNEPAKSEVKKQGFQGFLSTLFGWRRAGKTSTTKQPVEFVNVDVSSEQRIMQAAAEALAQHSSGKLNSKLEELFNSWLNDTTDSLQEITQRAKRVDQLTYAKLNDPFINRVVQLFADEATQLDMQDRIISIESPDPRMTKEMYNLLNQWGVTQQRCRAAMEQLATYGDCFWANKISENGVERIIPLKQLQITDRLEFNPVDALEKLKRKEGFSAMLDRQTMLKDMLEDMGETLDFADIFSTKLFGFAIQNDLVVPPWSTTHFRASADGSEFYPFGVSPILGTLAPFKLTASTITLQSIARVLNFPITLYKVKTTESADEGRQFAVVNRVREEYDNTGVTPSGNTEVYTVNTKIWMPDGLMDVEVKSAGVEMGFVEDIAMYQDRVAIASGVPKSFLDNEWGGLGNSARSLVEQYKPFARAVYSLQSAFLDGISDLFRLHFAINGKFDFRTPFTLALKYPADEMSSDKMEARGSSLDLAASVLEMIRAAIGAEEGESLPPDIIRDIMSKYTFLDPVDIIKWTRDANYFSGGKPTDEDEKGADSDFDLESDLGDAEDEGESFDDEVNIDDLDFGEASKLKQKRIREARMRELSVRYNSAKESIYFNTLKENSISSFVRKGAHIHMSQSHSCIAPMLEAFERNKAQGNTTGVKLREYTLRDMLDEVVEDNSTN